MKHLALLSFSSLPLLAALTAGVDEPPGAPDGLRVELLLYPDRISVGGMLSSAFLPDLHTLQEPAQVPLIRTAKPRFSWIVDGTRPNEFQTAYQILVASTAQALESDIGDVWDSGKVESASSVAAPYAGSPLSALTTYAWKVRTWDGVGRVSPYSRIQFFRTGDQTRDEPTSFYPLEKDVVQPKRCIRLGDGRYFIDFGKAAFGRVELTLTSTADRQSIRIHLGEVLDAPHRVHRNPGGSRRYKVIPLTLNQGTHTYQVLIPPDPRNTGPDAVRMPDYAGEVLPFRYCEVEGLQGELEPSQVRQIVIHYPFNERASSFRSSNRILNDVWELCKYSIKATSFAGIYVDGDRERVPYEADAYINQLAHYGVDAEYSMARRTHEYLISHATWPTEWILHSVLTAWEDYLYTGDPQSLERFYDDLKAKTLTALAREDGLISTRTGLVTPEVLQSIHLSGKLRDIVDWPHTGILGLGEAEGGETDGFVFTNFNAVVNAFHYRALVLMGRIAEILGRDKDAEAFSSRSDLVKESFSRIFFDSLKGYYVDGEGTGHSSLHANMFPLAFGLVPDNYKNSVLQFVISRGMACSVYGAQYLLDGLYEAGAEDYALDLLTATHDRSWAHMIYGLGTTITTEAWDAKYKPNMDWNHAWGAAPANVIPRRLVGVRPIEPGCNRILIQPQPGYLREFSATVPTIRGPVTVDFRRSPSGERQLRVVVPGNTTARVELPWPADGNPPLVDRSIPMERVENTAVLDSLGPGSHEIRY